MILDETAVIKTQKDSYSKGDSFTDYEKILSTKKNLYEDNKETNISSLNELLKITTVTEEKK